MAQIECKKVNCERKGYWIETLPDGEKLFCFRTRHDGENHAVKLTRKEMDAIYASGINRALQQL